MKDARQMVGADIESGAGTLTVVAVRAGQIVATQDGQDVDRSEWCACGSVHVDSDEQQVYYEIFGTTTGGEPMLSNRLAHGWVCSHCRRIVQAG